MKGLIWLIGYISSLSKAKAGTWRQIPGGTEAKNHDQILLTEMLSLFPYPTQDHQSAQDGTTHN